MFEEARLPVLKPADSWKRRRSVTELAMERLEGRKHTSQRVISQVRGMGLALASRHCTLTGYVIYSIYWSSRQPGGTNVVFRKKSIS